MDHESGHGNQFRSAPDGRVAPSKPMGYRKMQSHVNNKRKHQLTIDRTDVQDSLEHNGFERTHETKKMVEYRSRSNGKYIYFRTEIGLPEYIRFVIHPSEPLSKLTAVTGVTVNSPKEIQHGSNMTQFPKRKNRGVDEIHYGAALNVATASALKPFADAFHRL
jgi:predicted GNAT family acetyltransferase